jgi:hypothetical protein
LKERADVVLMTFPLRSFPVLRFAVIFPAVLILASCKDSAPTTNEASTALAPSQSAVSQPASSVGMNAVGIPAASIEAMVNPDHLPPYTGPTGSIEGTVSVIGDPPADVPDIDTSRCADAKQIYGKAFRTGAKLDDGSLALADVLIVVTEYPGGFIAEKSQTKNVVIAGCAFDKRTIDMTFGQKLLVVNHDPKGFYAPVLSNMEMPAVMIPAPNGDPITIYPDKPGYSRITDRLGSALAGDLYTLQQPLHTVSDVSGHYRIDGIPVGKSKVNARLRTINNNVTKPIDVHDGVVERVDLVLTYKAPATASASADAGATKPNLR